METAAQFWFWWGAQGAPVAFHAPKRVRRFAPQFAPQFG